VRSSYKEVFGSTEQCRVSCCQELGRVLQMAVECDAEETGRKKLDGENKTKCVV
jgi:hypothetical protein